MPKVKAYNLAGISVLIETFNRDYKPLEQNAPIETSLLALSQPSVVFEDGGMTKGCGTNSDGAVMLPYLGHDITIISACYPLVADTD